MSRSVRLYVVLGLNLAVVGVLVAVGVGAHSLGVLAEGVDSLADAAGIGVSLLAIRLSEPAATAAPRHRYPKAQAWAALVNGCWLVVLTGLVGIAAIGRLVSGTRVVRGLPVVIASGGAALVMAAGAYILKGGRRGGDNGDGNLNIRAVFLDTAADAAAAATVAVSGLIILLTAGDYWLDPTVASAVSAVIVYHATKLLRAVIASLRA